MKTLVQRAWLAVCAGVVSVVAADDLLVPSQYATIQEAVDAAEPGDVVHVAAGTYDELVHLRGKAITVRGESKSTTRVRHLEGNSRAQDDSTIFDCTGVPEPGAVIEGLALRGGRGTWVSQFSFCGGGVLAIDAAVTVRDCYIEPVFTDSDPYHTVAGAGIAAIDSRVTLDDVTIRNLGADRGGGIYCDSSTLVMTYSAISSCNAEYGSAIWAADTDITMSHCAVRNNGHGLFFADVDGAIRMQRGALVASETSFTENLFASADEAEFERCVFDRGSVQGQPGTDDVVMVVADSITVSGCTFKDLTAPGSTLAHSVELLGRDFIYVEGSEFARNGAERMFFVGDSGAVENCRFVQNDARVLSTVPLRNNSFCGEEYTYNFDQHFIFYTLDGGNTFVPRCDSTCRTNLVFDNDVNTLDFFQFLIWHSAGNMWVDFNGDERIDSNDFFAYLAAYEQGC